MEKELKIMNMKKTVIIVTAAFLLSISFAGAARQAKQLRKVVFETSMHCAKCEKKISENVPFEKGVEDYDSDLPTRTVTIVYDAAKTDTLKLATAIRDLGYTAKVLSDAEKSKK